MTDPTPDQWARLMSAVDQARADVTPSIDMSAFEVALEGDVRCEVRHISTPCTKAAKWSRPPLPCGCAPRLPACDGIHDYIFAPLDGEPYCNGPRGCGQSFPTSEWRKGWWPL